MADLSIIGGTAPSTGMSSAVTDDSASREESKDERSRATKRKSRQSATSHSTSQTSIGEENKEDDSNQNAGEGLAAERQTKRSRKHFDAVISSAILAVESSRDVPVFDASGGSVLLTCNPPEPSGNSSSSRTNGSSNLVVYGGPQVRRSVERQFPEAFGRAQQAGLQSVVVDLNYGEGPLSPLKGACDALKKMLQSGPIQIPAVRRVGFASLDMAMEHHRLLFDTFRAIPETKRKEKKGAQEELSSCMVCWKETADRIIVGCGHSCCVDCFARYMDGEKDRDLKSRRNDSVSVLPRCFMCKADVQRMIFPHHDVRKHFCALCEGSDEIDPKRTYYMACCARFVGLCEGHHSGIGRCPACTQTIPASTKKDLVVHVHWS